MGVTRIGLLGGSFDPVHIAHIALATHALHALQLDEVQFIPAAHPWQRDALRASPEARRDMLMLAIAEQPGLRVNPIELERGGATYTIDTLRALPAHAHYVWLLGTDQLANFCTWREWREVARLADLAVATRPGTPLAPPPALAQWLLALQRPLHTLAFTPMAVSASDIRRRLAHHESISGLLPDAVAAYIATHHLYR